LGFSATFNQHFSHFFNMKTYDFKRGPGGNAGDSRTSSSAVRSVRLHLKLAATAEASRALLPPLPPGSIIYDAGGFVRNAGTIALTAVSVGTDTLPTRYSNAIPTVAAGAGQSLPSQAFAQSSPLTAEESEQGTYVYFTPASAGNLDVLFVIPYLSGNRE
jgi:hypothetical protein